MILAIDTSTSLTSVAVLDDGVLVDQWWHDGARSHAEAIGPMLQSAAALLRAREGVALVACGVGPGPYTGLRVGIAAAQALALAWQVPVVGVCSLDAIAAAVQASQDTAEIVVATDARRSEVYWAQYSSDGRRTDGPHVGRPDDVTVSGTWVGRGAVLHGRSPALLQDLPPASPLVAPTAEWVARIAETHQASVLLAQEPLVLDLSAHGSDGGASARAVRGRILLPPRPLYLRRPDAAEPVGAAR